MPFPVTFSSVPIVADTLPALKVRYYCGTAAHKKLYAYARLYVLQGSLQLSLYCFEQTPTANSRLSFLLSKRGKSMVLSVWEKQASLSFQTPLGESTLELPVPSFFSANDEQGWYWGAHISIPDYLLQQGDFYLHCGESFVGALFQHVVGQAGFGSCFEISNTDTMADIANCKSFLVVPY